MMAAALSLAETNVYKEFKPLCDALGKLP